MSKMENILYFFKIYIHNNRHINYSMLSLKLYITHILYSSNLIRKNYIYYTFSMFFKTGNDLGWQNTASSQIKVITAFYHNECVSFFLTLHNSSGIRFINSTLLDTNDSQPPTLITLLIVFAIQILPKQILKCSFSPEVLNSPTH